MADGHLAALIHRVRPLVEVESHLARQSEEEGDQGSRHLSGHVGDLWVEAETVCSRHHLTTAVHNGFAWLATGQGCRLFSPMRLKPLNAKKRCEVLQLHALGALELSDQSQVQSRGTLLALPPAFFGAPVRRVFPRAVRRRGGTRSSGFLGRIQWRTAYSRASPSADLRSDRLAMGQRVVELVVHVGFKAQVVQMVERGIAGCFCVHCAP